MIIVHHRRNHARELADVPQEAGVEIDIRSYGSDLIIQHEPFKPGELLEDWLVHYQHQLLVLNTKEEGLEQRCLKLMKNFKISNFFFLDQSFPYLIKTVLSGERRCAVRVSEYESMQTALALKGMIEWLWVDTFTRFPLNTNELQQLSEVGYKFCVVSPELLGREGLDEIKKLRNYFKHENINIDAVCTDLSQAWQ